MSVSFRPPRARLGPSGICHYCESSVVIKTDDIRLPQLYYPFEPLFSSAELDLIADPLRPIRVQTLDVTTSTTAEVLHVPTFTPARKNPREKGEWSLVA